MKEILTHRASRAQRRLWFVEQLVPGEPVHTVGFDVPFPDPLDAAAVRAAVADLIARHESLRTRFVVRDNELWQVVLTPPDEPPVELVDLSGAADPAEACVRLGENLAATVFDLGTAPLLRVAHVRLGARGDTVLVAVHHAVADAISSSIFVGEFIHAYLARSAGVAPDFPELTVQYADFTAWQEEQAAKPVARRDLAYWREQLAGISTLDLTNGRRRPSRISHRGRRLDLTVGQETAAMLDEFVRGERATPFMGMLATYAAVLGRVFGSEDVAVGCTVAGRPLPEVQRVIGMFVDRSVLRFDLSGGPTFRQLVAMAREAVTAAHDHGSVTFDQIVDAVAPEREIGVTPLAQAAINLQPRPDSDRVLDAGMVPHDLAVDITKDGTGYSGIVGYRTDVVSAESAELVRDAFVRFLREGLTAPDRPLWTVPVASADPPAKAATGGPELLHEVIAQWAGRTPDAPALVTASGTLTFASLNAAANRLAHALRGRGAGPETPVLVAIARSAELFVAMLGVLKAGGVYVPVDPSAPAAHLSSVVDQCGATLALAVDSFPGLPAEVMSVDAGVGPDPGPPNVPVRPENAAYLLFTSGSTGPPKGVLVEHRNVVSYLRGLLELFPPAASHLTLQPPTFDSSMTSTLGALANGGALHIVDDDIARDPGAMADYLATHQVDFMKITPSHLSALLAGDVRLRLGQAVILGGEAAAPALTNRLLRDGCGVIVHYGPTEGTIGVCARWLRSDGEPPVVILGTPLPGVGVYVLDRWLQPVPVGCRGELYVGGPQVTRGYLGSASLTAARFVPEPFTGGRMYRTGDLVRRLPGGDLEFCGRADRQVKIRGFRVEPGSVESVLDSHPGVRRSVVVADGGRLVAYVTPSTVDPVRLRDFVAGVLPAHSVPAEVVPLAELPMTRHGKLDLSMLPDPEPAVGHPESQVERELLECWREALPGRNFGVTDEFFAVGGDSVLAIHVVAAARRRGLSLTLRQLFAHRTIRAIAPALDLPDAAASTLGITGPTVVRVPHVDRAPNRPGVSVADACLVSFDPARVDDRSIGLILREMSGATADPVPADAHEAYGTTTLDLVVAATMAALDTTAVTVADTQTSFADEIGQRAKPGVVRVDTLRVNGDLIRDVKAAVRSATGDDPSLAGVRVIPLPDAAVVTEAGTAGSRVIVTFAGSQVLVSGPAEPDLATRIAEALTEIVAHCAAAEPVYSAADFPDTGLDEAGMARLLAGLDLDLDEEATP